MDKSKQNRILAGVILTLMGLYLGLISFLPLEMIPGGVNVPRWVLFLLALVFGAASLLAFLGPDRRGGNLMAAAIFFLLAVTGAWIALSGSPAAYSGGIKSLAPQHNRFLGRIVFGTGAALNLGLGIYAVRRYFQK